MTRQRSSGDRSGTLLKSGILLFWICLIGAYSSIATLADDQKSPESRGDLLLIVGSPGEPIYAAQFEAWTSDWKQLAAQGHLSSRQIGPGTAMDQAGTLHEIEVALKELSVEKDRPLWIILIGHGTFDGKNAKFNLPGPDLEPSQLASWLQPIERPVAVVNCFSCSAPFLPALSRSGRVVITSTMNGNEVNFSRFGGELVKAIVNPEADLDKDGQVTLLEAFLKAASATEEHYVADGRLATEHAVIDDNGDGRSVPHTGFDGLRAKNRNDTGAVLPDGLRAHQWAVIANPSDLDLPPEVIARRNELELQIYALTQQKTKFSASDYDTRLEELLLQIADLILPTRAKNPSSVDESPMESSEKSGL